MAPTAELAQFGIAKNAICPSVTGQKLRPNEGYWA